MIGGIMMSFLDSVKESLVSASKDVTQKAKEVSGVAKLKLDIKTKEDFVEKQYAILGHSYFDAHKDDEENAENEQFKVIKEALSEIESMKAEILKLQGAAECPNCGAKVPQDAAYCSSCGTKIEKEEETTEEEDIFDAEYVMKPDEEEAPAEESAQEVAEEEKFEE